MLRTRVVRLKRRFQDFQATQKFPPQPPDSLGYRQKPKNEETKARNEVFLKILRDACALVREAEAWKSPDLPALVDAIHNVVDRSILLADGLHQMFDYMPSWAHDVENESPLLEDPDEKDGTIREQRVSLLFHD